MRTTLPIALIAALALTTAATAQDAEAENAGGEAMAAKVVSVEGPAQKLTRPDGAEEYQSSKLEKDDELHETDVVRTGLGAKVVLAFADRAVLTIRGATKVGVSSFRRKGERVEGRVGLKYGSLYADVDRTKGENQFEVATPVALAAVRGTEGGIVYTADLGMALTGTEGTWSLHGSGPLAVRSGETSDGNLTPPTQIAVRNRHPVLGDTHGGLSDAEKSNQRYNGDGRGIFGFAGGGQTGDNLFRLPVKSRCSGHYIIKE